MPSAGECRKSIALMVVAGVLGLALTTAAARPAAKVAGTSGVKPLVIAHQGVFFVGGRYISVGGQTAMEGQMFVQFQIPAHRRRPYPIVLIHGQGQSGVNFLGTPDGREGWADMLLRMGYAVYVVDQPMRGRSSYRPELDGPLALPSVDRVEKQFTHAQPQGEAAQDRRHTQWPGSGQAGDPAFDQFYASQLGSTASDAERMDALARDAGAALLDRIGPAIVLTHSRGGPFGWLIADARPGLVKAIVAIEPSGPPFGDDGKGHVARAWGLSTAPLTYDPAAASSAALAPVQDTTALRPGMARCWHTATPRRLVNLAAVPVAVVTGEASYHQSYDGCTVQFLKAAGVGTDYLDLGAMGIHGNGHMMMLEKNSADVINAVDRWIKLRVRSTSMQRN